MSMSSMALRVTAWPLPTGSATAFSGVPSTFTCTLAGSRVPPSGRSTPE